jgi:hypothetical protein
MAIAEPKTRDPGEIHCGTRSEPDESSPAKRSPAAERALDEAAARRVERERIAGAGKPQRELGGRDGLDPVRYGDWEVKGIASDF